MDKLTFEKIICAPSTLSSEEAVMLEELAQEFPYCQMAHLLIANDSFQKKSMHYPKKLKRASTYILDRTVLHSFLYKKETGKSQEKQEISQIDEAIRTDAPLQEDQAGNGLQTVNYFSENTDLLKEIEQNLIALKHHKEKYKNTYFSESGPEDRSINKTTGVTVLSEPASIVIARPESKLGEELTVQESENVRLLLEYLQNNTPVIHISEYKENIQTGIINKFIEAQPRLNPRSSIDLSETENPDLSLESTELKLELITENFAQILTKQNKIEKAIEVYKKLILKYPDKSAYFALKLNELESR